MDIRGKGFGRKLAELNIEYLKKNYPYATQTLALIADHDLPNNEIFNSKHGELLSKKSVVLYQVKYQEIADFLVKYFGSLPKPRNENMTQFILKDEFKQVLRNEKFVSEALENKTLIINWQPILLKTEKDIEFATMGNQNVLLEGNIQNPIALSIFTCPFPIADGKSNVVLDFYKCKPGVSGMSIVEHLTKHLIYFLSLIHI